MQPQKNSSNSAYQGSVYDSSLESQPTPLDAVQTSSPDIDPSRHSFWRFFSFRRRKNLFVVNAVVLALIALIGVGGYLLSANANLGNANGKKTAGYATSLLPIQNVQGSAALQIGTTDHLSINGQVTIGNTLILNPTATPNNPVAGQIYYNQSTNLPYYYNGKQFIPIGQGAVSPQSVTSIGGSSGAIGLGNGLHINGGVLGLSGAVQQQSGGQGVTSLQGQTGAVQLRAGAGITLNGTTITNSGVLSLAAGTSNLSVSNDGSGNYTVSDNTVNVITGTGTAGQIALFTGSQSLANSILNQSGSTLTAAGSLVVQGAAAANSLNIGSGSLTVDGSGNLATSGTLSVNDIETISGSDLHITAGGGSGEVTFFANGDSYALPAPIGAPSGQTICTTATGCASGLGAAVILQPGAAQIDNGNKSSIWVNNVNGGNLLQLEGGGANSFVVTNAGAVTAAGGLSVQGAAGITLGKPGPAGVTGALTFQNSANTNTFKLQSGATTGNLTFTLPTSDGIPGNCIKTDGSGGLSFGSCASGSGVTTVGAIDSQTPSADGAVINGTNIYLQDAAAGNVGLVSTGSQTFGGAKTFNGDVTLSGAGTGLSVANAATIGTGLTVNSGGVTITNGGLTVSAGGAAITGNSTINGSLGSLTGLSSSGSVTFSGLNTAGIVTNTAGGVLGTTTTLGVGNGGTGSGSFTLNGVLYGNGSGTIQATAAAANSILATNGSNVPGLTQMLPAAVQGNITATGALASGSIASGFGAISTGSNIQTTATVQGGTVIATGAIQGNSLSVNSGAFAVNSTGAVTAATGITSSGSVTFSGLGAGVVHAGAGGGLTSSAIVNSDLQSGSFTNITAVGTLTSLTSAGAITFSGLNTAGIVTNTAGGVLGTIATLGVGNGGTGAGSLTANGILYGAGTGAIQATAAAANSILATDGSNIPGLTQTLPSAVQGNITATGVLAAGSINTGFGAISTGNNIQTTATVQGGTVVATGALQGNSLSVNSGNFAVNSAGAITAATGITSSGSIKFSGLGCNLVSYTGCVLIPDSTGALTAAPAVLGTNTSGQYVSGINGHGGAFTIANSSYSSGTITINDASTTQKGIAQFNSTNFSASSGTINTIQNITTNSAPTFNALTLQSTTTALTLNGPPSGTVSLVQLGSALGTGAGSAINSNGTFVGLNAGSGSTADFLNFQNNGVSKLRIDGSGDISTTGNVSAVGSLSVVSSGGGTVSFTAPSGLSSNLSFALPTSYGSGSNLCLKESSAGVTAWVSCISSSGGGGSGTSSIVNTQFASFQTTATFGIQSTDYTTGDIIEEGPNAAGTAADLLQFQNNNGVTMSAFNPAGQYLRIDGATGYSSALTIGTTSSISPSDGISLGGGNESLYSPGANTLYLQGGATQTLGLTPATGVSVNGSSFDIQGGAGTGIVAGGDLSLQVAAPPLPGVNESLVATSGHGLAMTADIGPTPQFIYWANHGTSGIGRAGLAGTGVNQTYISGSNGKCTASTSNPSNSNGKCYTGTPSLTVDGTYIYWSSGFGCIGQAQLNTTAGSSQTAISPNPYFLCNNGNNGSGNGTLGTLLTGINSITYSGGWLYWVTSSGASLDPNCIGRAQVTAGVLVNASVNPGWICNGVNGATVANPNAIAINGNYMYWASGNTANLSISYASTAYSGSGSVGQGNFAVAAMAQGLAFDSGNNMYWTESSTNVIGRVTVNPSTGAPLNSTDNDYPTNPLFSPANGNGGPNAPVGVAIAGSTIFWANSLASSIATTSIGGSSPNSERTVADLTGSTGSAWFSNTDNNTQAFQIQNSSSASLFNVDSSFTSNLITNGDFENYDGVSHWSALGSDQLNTDTINAWQGNSSMQVTTVANNDGASSLYAFKPSTWYTLSLYVLAPSGTISDFSFGRQDNGSLISCGTYNVSATSWTRLTCDFQTGATINSSFIYVAAATAGETFNVDGVQLQLGANSSSVPTPFNAGGGIQLNGVVNSPLTIQNKTDSNAAFQIQNAAGTSNLFVADTLNGRIGIGTNTPGNLLSIGALTTAQSTYRVAVSTGGTTNSGIVVQDVLGQSSGNLLQAQDSTGAALATLDYQGNLTVKAATVNGILTINGHIITGNTSGSTTFTNGTQATCNASSAGNDTGGKLVITASGTPATGTQCTVTFSAAFGTAPHPVISPVTANAIGLFYTGTIGVNSFTVDFNGTPGAGASYTLDYFNAQ